MPTALCSISVSTTTSGSCIQIISEGHERQKYTIGSNASIFAPLTITEFVHPKMLVI